jgi:hypothetical protein
MISLVNEGKIAWGFHCKESVLCGHFCDSLSLSADAYVHHVAGHFCRPACTKAFAIYFADIYGWQTACTSDNSAPLSSFQNGCTFGGRDVSVYAGPVRQDFAIREKLRTLSLISTRL